MAIQRPPARSGKQSTMVHIGVGEGRAVIVQAFGWTIAVNVDDARSIAHDLTRAADLVDAQQAVATTLPPPIPPAGGKPNGKGPTKRGRKAAES